MLLGPKGLPYLDPANDYQLPLPDPQAYMAALAAAADARVDHIGVSNISTTETVNSAAYALAPTPDRVQNIILPTDGLLQVGFVGLWKATAAATYNAAIFIGANQLKAPNTASGGAPLVQEAQAVTAGSTGMSYLTSTRYGLGGAMVVGADASTVTTGLSLWNTALGEGGLCWIWANAGTYDISVQYKNSAGSFSIKERRLWVHAIPYL
jgi:hypothetical protein